MTERYTFLKQTLLDIPEIIETLTKNRDEILFYLS